jgi:small GTP-binding protein
MQSGGSHTFLYRFFQHTERLLNVLFLPNIVDHILEFLSNDAIGAVAALSKTATSFNPDLTALVIDYWAFDRDQRWQFDIALLGNFSVGKSTLLGSSCTDKQNKPTPPQFTQVLEFYTTAGHVQLRVRDTRGEERYGCVRTAHCSGIAAAILVYDMSLSAFHNSSSLASWMRELKDDNGSSLPVVFCGSKIDLVSSSIAWKRKVSLLDKCHWLHNQVVLHSPTLVASLTRRAIFDIAYKISQAVEAPHRLCHD